MSYNYHTSTASIVKIVSYINDGILIYCDRIYYATNVQEVFDEICRRIHFHQSIHALGTLYPANALPYSYSAYVTIRFINVHDKTNFLRAFRDYERNQLFINSQANQIVQMHQNVHMPTIVEVPIVHTYVERFDNVIIHEMQIKRELIQIPTQVRIHQAPLHFNDLGTNSNIGHYQYYDGSGHGPIDLSLRHPY